MNVDIAAVNEMEPRSSNRVVVYESRPDSFGLPSAVVKIERSARDLATLRRLRELSREILERLGAYDIKISDLETSWTHHHMGTCRMGSNPLTSVVDEHLRVRGTRNLYIAGSAAFVTGGAGGPTVLLTALALRLADHLRGIERLADRRLRVQTSLYSLPIPVGW